MTKKEKWVMNFLCKKCQKHKSYLIEPQEISQNLSKRYVLSIDEIDEIMMTLANENYIDFVVSQGKMGYCYCVNLKKKGQNFLIDTRKNHKIFGMLVLRSCFLATVSFVFGVLLKAIFKN